MTKYTIADGGWISSVLEDINGNKPFIISVTGKAAIDILHRMQETSHKLANFPLFKQGLAFALSIVPGASAIPVSPEVIMVVLSSIGALGGAAGSVATCTGVAVSHGYSLSLAYSFGKLFDPTDDAVEFQLTPAAKPA